jgi:hypothetical protein
MPRVAEAEPPALRGGCGEACIACVDLCSHFATGPMQLGVGEASPLVVRGGTAEACTPRQALLSCSAGCCSVTPGGTPLRSADCSPLALRGGTTAACLPSAALSGHNVVAGMCGTAAPHRAARKRLREVGLSDPQREALRAATVDRLGWNAAHFDGIMALLDKARDTTDRGAPRSCPSLVALFNHTCMHVRARTRTCSVRLLTAPHAGVTDLRRIDL